MAARDILIAGIIVFTLAIGLFIAYMISNTVITSMMGISQINQSASAVAALQGSQKVTNQMDYVVLGVFIGLTLAIIITGWFIGGNPIFMAVYSLVWVIAIVLSTILANTWETTTQSSVFGTTISHFPIANNLLLGLPIYIGIVGFLGLVVMFAKPYIFNQGGGSGEY